MDTADEMRLAAEPGEDARESSPLVGGSPAAAGANGGDAAVHVADNGKSEQGRRSADADGECQPGPGDDDANGAAPAAPVDKEAHKDTTKEESGKDKESSRHKSSKHRSSRRSSPRRRSRSPRRRSRSPRRRSRSPRRRSRSPRRRSRSPRRRSRSPRRRSRDRSVEPVYDRSAELAERAERIAAARKAAAAAELARVAEMTRLQALQAAAVQQPPAQALQATRHARRLYVSGLPAGISEVALANFFNQVMLAVGVTTALGLPVTGVHLNPEPRRFAFVEFRSVHEASNALAFDGVTCQGEPLRVQRPHDYNAAAAVALGPSLPPPALTPALLSAVGALVDETAAPRVSVLGLPPSWAEDRVNALLGRFGALRGLSLVRGPDGAPSGAALAEYIDPGALPAVLASINGLQLEGSYTVQVSQTVNQDTVAALKHLITQQQTSLMARLTARPPPELVPPPAELPATLAAVVVAALTVGQPGAAALPVSLALPGALLGALPGPPAGPTPTARTVVLRGMVERSELTDDGEFADIMEDTREEVTKYGELEEVVIPRPDASNPAADPPGVGLVVLRYRDALSAERARIALNGRGFAGRTITATVLDDAAYQSGRFE